MKQRVLIVTYYWPPSGGAGVQRYLKFAKYLPGFDIQPYVLTVENPTYPILDESLEKDIPEEAVVFKSRSFEPFEAYARLTGKSVSDSVKPTITLRSGNWKSRLSAWIRANIFVPDARIGWLLTARSAALDLVQEHQIDTIITTGPPHSCHFVGRYVQQHAQTKWIADFRDPWTGVYYNQLLPRCELARSLDKRMELNVLRRADEVIVVSETMAKIQNNIYPRKYHVLPNGFDPDDFEGSPDHPVTAGVQEGCKVIRFVGSVREGAIPETFLKAVSRLSNKNGLKVEFVGNAHPALQKLIHRLDLKDTVEIRGYVPHEEAVQLMVQSDLLLLSISTTPNSDLILTGKLFEYLGSGTPILFLGSTTGDAAKIIRETGQGTCFEHGMIEEVCGFLKKFIRGECIFNTARERSHHQYSRKTLTQNLAELITD